MISFKKEQIYIVTGASSGIGQCTALLLNELGATVIGIARNKERLLESKNGAKYPENFHIEVKDLAEGIENLPQYIKSLKEKYGKFAGMAYCSGITDVKPLQMLDLSEIKKQYDINLFAPIFMTKGLADRRNNIGKGCSCVYISSQAVFVAERAHSTYTGSKSALCGTIRSLAKELAPQGIRLNCVLPADIETKMIGLDGPFAEEVQNRLSKYPMGIGKVSDVANMIMFLLSDKSRWITGQNYVIDCGSL